MISEQGLEAALFAIVYFFYAVLGYDSLYDKRQAVLNKKYSF